MSEVKEQKAELITADKFIDSQLTKFEFKREDLEALAKEYSELTIAGVDDKAGYSKVHEARMTLVRKRTAIEKVVKDLKGVANIFKKSVDERGDEFVDIIYPTETALEEKEVAIDLEKERIRAEKQKADDDRIQAMIDQLAAVGQVADYVTIKGYNQEQFEEVLAEATTIHNQKLEEEERARESERVKQELDASIRLENERLAEEKRKQEEEANAIERERLKKVQEEQDRIAQELVAEKERMAEELRVSQEANRLEREKLEKERKALHHQRLDAKHSLLFSLGFKWDGETFIYEDKIFIDWSDVLAKWSDEEFLEQIDKVKDKIFEIHQEKIALEAREKGEAEERAAKVKAAEDERLRLKAIEDARLEEEVRIEAMNAASDPKKFRIMYMMIAEFYTQSDWPAFTSRIGTDYSESVMGHLQKAIEICQKKMETNE